jgi:peptidyl-tRNA hydrolase
MRLPKILIALSLGGLALAGCGGGDDETTESTATAEAPAALSKSELISQGDAICAEVNAAVGSVAASESADETARVADLYVGMVDSLQNLGAPAEEAGYPEFIAAAEGLSQVEGELKLAAEREDAATLEEASAAAVPALEEFEDEAAQYGFEECGEEPTAPAPSGSGSAPVEEAEEGGLEVAPEEIEEEVIPEEVAPEEVAPETGGAGGGIEEAAPESGGGESGGGSSGGVGPG